MKVIVVLMRQSVKRKGSQGWRTRMSPQFYDAYICPLIAVCWNGLQQPTYGTKIRPSSLRLRPSNLEPRLSQHHGPSSQTRHFSSGYDPNPRPWILPSATTPAAVACAALPALSEPGVFFSSEPAETPASRPPRPAPR